jgi:hypothetical protein
MLEHHCQRQHDSFLNDAAFESLRVLHCSTRQVAGSRLMTTWRCSWVELCSCVMHTPLQGLLFAWQRSHMDHSESRTQQCGRVVMQAAVTSWAMTSHPLNDAEQERIGFGASVAYQPTARCKQRLAASAFQLSCSLTKSAEWRPMPCNAHLQHAVLSSCEGYSGTCRPVL